MAEIMKITYFEKKTNRALKIGIWVYFILLLSEGALRKWVFPSLSSILLVVRDPVAIWILFKAYTSGVVKMPPSVIILDVVTVIAIFAALIFGHGNLVVALYGARIFIIHFPLIFVIGAVFTKKDLLHVGKLLLYITVPVTFLVISQFFSPQSAWVNRGVGGDLEGAGFGGAMGYFRPPGLFSFTNGNVFFYSLVGCFILYFWLAGDRRINRFVLIASTLAFLASIPLSISRTMLFQSILTVSFGLFSVARRSDLIARVVVFICGCIVIVLLLSQFAFFETAIDVFSSRFVSANDTEGGLKGTLVDRFLGGMFGALFNDDTLPFFGHGIGMGTNVGSMLLVGSMTFLIAEVEWGRIIGEMGILLGVLIISVRVFLTSNLLWRSYVEIKCSNLLPWILMSFAAVNILQGQLAQPTTLGFTVVSAGFAMAALQEEQEF